MSCGARPAKRGAFEIGRTAQEGKNMEQQAAQQTEIKKEGKTGKYVRWVITILGITVIFATFIMAIYRKFGG